MRTARLPYSAAFGRVFRLHVPQRVRKERSRRPLDAVVRIKIGMKCYLFGTNEALVTSGDHENQERIRCPSADCGEYVISNHAVRRLAEGGLNRDALIGMVQRANDRKRLLDISIAPDGLVHAPEIPMNA
jgi:hypothetical protein